MKKRLDVLIHERGLTPSRERAKALIMEGIVYVNGVKEDKAGSTFPESAAIEIRGKTLAYVSRGGLKLEKAMKVFPVSPEGKVCLDIGASTGGFTDCMLQNGAGKVYAIDVGYGQLAWKLRSDPRVISMEKTNIRYVTETDIPEKAGLASVDVSFISLGLVFPAAVPLLSEDGVLISLIKPQFEAGRDKVGHKGVVRDKAVHREVIASVLEKARLSGLFISGLDYSPVKGPEGNIEYLAYFRKTEDPSAPVIDEETIRQVVEEAHKELDK